MKKDIAVDVTVTVVPKPEFDLRAAFEARVLPHLLLAVKEAEAEGIPLVIHACPARNEVGREANTLLRSHAQGVMGCRFHDAVASALMFSGYEGGGRVRVAEISMN